MKDDYIYLINNVKKIDRLNDEEIKCYISSVKGELSKKIKKVG